MIYNYFEVFSYKIPFIYIITLQDRKPCFRIFDLRRTWDFSTHVFMENEDVGHLVLTWWAWRPKMRPNVWLDTYDVPCSPLWASSTPVIHIPIDLFVLT